MKLKLDENLGRRGATLLRAAGHDVATVVEQASRVSDIGSWNNLTSATREPNSLLQHTANLGELMGAIMKVASFIGDICGTPSPALLKAVEPAASAFKPSQSL